MKDLGVSTRYAHSDGYTIVCYTKDGSHILTSGTDGDVRIWKNIEQDEPVTIKTGEVIHSLIYGNEHYYVGTEDNDIQKRTFPEGEMDGTVLRFTAPVTTMCLSQDCNVLYAGSGDFDIKYIDQTSDKIITLSGHQAPILCVTINDNKKLLASSSCDGSIRIWDLSLNKTIKIMHLLTKANDFSLSKSYCQMAWTKDSLHLLIPIGKTIEIHSIRDWCRQFTLKHESIEENIDIVRVSPCGLFIAGGCRDGTILIWRLSTMEPVASYESFRKFGITGMCWNPKTKSELMITDNQGNVGIFDDVLPAGFEEEGKKEEEDDPTMDDLFDDIDTVEDNILATPADTNDSVGYPEGSDDTELKLEDVDKMLMDENNKDLSDFSDVEDLSKPVRKPPKVFFQPPFQSGSTPTHLPHRFMLWNSVGIIKQYNTDEENSVDVEFHDTSTHHAIHINNNAGFTMAALSTQVVALASQADVDVASILSCTMLNTQDAGKQWTVNMDGSEDIQCVAAGDDWVCVITSSWLIRVFSTSGIQRTVLSIPGPVVSAAGYNQYLLVVYHRGAGFLGSQALGVQLFNVGKQRQTIIQGDLPLTPRTTLMWLGFTAEGSPVSVDSSGRLLMLKRRAGCTWLPLGNMRDGLSGLSDNYWIVSVHQHPAEVRAILCKGGKYPPTLPRPVTTSIKFYAPLCDASTEKTSIETSYWNSVSLLDNLNPSVDPDEEEDTRNSLLMEQQEALIKLFALSCKSGFEQRAYDLCCMMSTSHAVQLAIKYATRLRRLQLAEQLSVLAQHKAEREENGEGSDEEQVDDWALPQPNIENTSASKQRASDNEEDEEEETQEVEDESQEMEEEEAIPKLLLKPKKSENLELNSTSNSQLKKNPFKRSISKTSSGKGSQIFDTVPVKPSKTAAAHDVITMDTKRSKTVLVRKPRKSKTTKTATDTNTTTAAATTEPSAPPVKTGFQVWLEANREGLLKENVGEAGEEDLTVLAAKTYKQLSQEEKNEWKAKAASGTKDTEDRKRKRSCENSAEVKGELTPQPVKVTSPEEEPEAKKKPLGNTSNKLASFAFKQK